MRSSTRIAMHIHTEWSFDANWSLDEVAKSFKRRGYNVIMTAEHAQSMNDNKWRQYQDECERASKAGILLIPGVEYRDRYNLIHIPVWGTGIPYFADPMDIGELLHQVSEHRAVAVFAHPGRRSALSEFQPTWRAALRGVEVWNRKYDGWAPNQQAVEIAARTTIPAMVSLDFHGRRQFFPLAMTVNLSAPPTIATVIGQLLEGKGAATVLRRPVAHWSHGRRLSTLQALERGRTAVAPLLRRWK